MNDNDALLVDAARTGEGENMPDLVEWRMNVIVKKKKTEDERSGMQMRMRMWV